MRQIVLRLTVALLAFVFGVACAISYSTYASYQLTVLHAREATLRDSLFRMRNLIDQHAADKGSPPQSLDDLVSSGYLREIPEDPFTGQRDWVVVVGDDPSSSATGRGMVNVHSASSGMSREGTRYKEW